MAEESKIHDFIEKAVRAGAKFKEIEKVLLEAGWEKSQITSALNFYHESKFPVAVPKPKQIAAPRLGVLNFFYFGAFYTTMCVLTFAIFTLLDSWLPDGLGRMEGAFRTYNIREAMQTYLSILIVSFPLALYSGHLIEKAIKSSGQRIPAIRLKLIYLSMLIGAIILAVCAILFVNYAIDGILSWRFSLKVLILLLKFGGIYLYFKPELYRNE
jgi:hypothetical protein